MNSPERRQALHTLAERFIQCFPLQIDGARQVGREAEYPLVERDGRAADVARLWPLLQADDDLQPKVDAVNQDLIVGLEGLDYSYALEVGRGTLEITTRPCQTLFELQSIHHTALIRLVNAARQVQLRVLGYGIQPVTPASAELLSPKQRYRAMLRSMGDEWLTYTVTASDQLHVDVARTELTQQLNAGLMMAPVVIALCGNSPIYAGGESGYCSGREALVSGGRHAGERHGMPSRPYADVLDFVQRLAQLPFLLKRSGDHLLPNGRPFAQILDGQVVDFDAFLLHDHYVWQSARLRTAHGTLELRCACQQPPGGEMAAAALYLGLAESAKAITQYVGSALGDQMWQRLRAYQQDAIRHGLAAPQPRPDFLTAVLDLVEAGLVRRGYGEAALLSPLWNRLHAGKNPGQRAQAAFHEGEMAALLAHVAYP